MKFFDTIFDSDELLKLDQNQTKEILTALWFGIYLWTKLMFNDTSKYVCYTSFSLESIRYSQHNKCPVCIECAQEFPKLFPTIPIFLPVSTAWQQKEWNLHEIGSVSIRKKNGIIFAIYFNENHSVLRLSLSCSRSKLYIHPKKLPLLRDGIS